MHLNVTTKQYEKINYPTNIPAIYPEKIYFWNDDELIVHNNKNFYTIDCRQKAISIKPTKLIKEAHCQIFITIIRNGQTRCVLNLDGSYNEDKSTIAENANRKFT